MTENSDEKSNDDDIGSLNIEADTSPNEQASEDESINDVQDTDSENNKQ